MAIELAVAKSKGDTTKADAVAIMVVYRSDAETAQARVKEVANTDQTRAYRIAKDAKCQSRRETLEEIHTRGFDLIIEINYKRT